MCRNVMNHRAFLFMAATPRIEVYHEISDEDLSAIERTVNDQIGGGAKAYRLAVVRKPDAEESEE